LAAQLAWTQAPWWIKLIAALPGFRTEVRAERVEP
jgi:hypothetical protein